VLAAVEVIGKSPGSLLSGLIAERIGYPVLFSIGVALSVLILLLFFPLRRSMDPSEFRGEI